MKTSIKYLFAALALIGLGTTSCSDFGDVNVDPEQPNEGNLNYAFVFSQAQHQALGSDWDVWRTGCIYSAQFMQHVTSIDWWDTYNCYAWSDGYASAYWDGVYKGSRGAIRDIQSVIKDWKDKEGYENDYQMARIVRAYLFHRMTDLYGDIPYSEAGQAEVTNYPKYDKQEDIYTDLLKELDEAQSALSTNVTPKVGSHDLYLNGDVAAWKKFANSLMLRVAMRLVKVKPELAKEYAAKAYANGVITNVADNVMLKHTDGSSSNDSAEPYAKIFSHEDYEFFMSKTFIDQLRNTNDPRLALVACVCEHPSYNSDNDKYETGNSDPSLQRGLPSGGYTGSKNNARYIGNFDTEFQNIVTKNGTEDVDVSLYESNYSVPNRLTYGDETGPTMIVTAAETNLLLAEAALRGYISGDAQSFYEAGVRAAMLQFQYYTKASSIYNQYITEEAISNYLAANPYDASKALEQINTQYWITTFCDEYESFANWRRTGYPKLDEKRGYGSSSYGTSSWYAQSITNNQSIPRRFTYPSSEEQSNNANYKEAVSRLSDGNTFTSRMWWDVAQ